MTDYETAYKTPDYFGRDKVSLLDRFEHLIEPGGSVLDIGIGQGRNAFPLAHAGFDVHGIDLAAAAIEACTARARRERVSVTLWNGSFEDYRPPRRFDAALVFGVMQETTVEQHARLVPLLAEWIRPGGLLFVIAWHTGDPAIGRLQQTAEAIGRHSYRLPNGKVRTFLEPGEICSLFDRWEPTYHWEGLGEPHHHGDGQMEQHSRVEFVGRLR
jgi:2-polyprenyl-3-methyl-5-hydroxy-6-metoxy-1,4-benzoquinol methylase